jgi:hypothetical protein
MIVRYPGNVEARVDGSAVAIISAEGREGELIEGDIIVFLNGRWLVNPGWSKDLPDGIIGYHLIDGVPTKKMWATVSIRDVSIDPGVSSTHFLDKYSLLNV